MRKILCSLRRLSVHASAIATLAFSLAHAQQPGPAVTLAKSAGAPATAMEPSGGVAISQSAEIQQNYREFSQTRVSLPSEPEGFTLEFHAAARLGAISATQDFHVSGGSCTEGNLYRAGDVCTVQVVFTPRGPGRRTGQLSIAHSASATPLLTPLGGTGYGPTVMFTPSQMKVVPGSFTGTGTAAAGILLGPQALAVDGGDNLYVADTGNNLIRFRDSSGAFSVLAGGGTNSAAGYSGFGSGVKLDGPSGIGVDYSGTVFFSDTGDSLVLVRYIDGILNTRIGGGPTSTGCSYTAPCTPFNIKITPPYAIAVDAYGSIYTTLKVGGALPGFYIAEDDQSQNKNQYYILSTTAYNYYSTSPSLAVDPYGDMVYTYEDPGGPLLSPTPLCYILSQNRSYSVGNTASQRFWSVAGSGPCGFSGDGGKASGAEISTNIGQFAWDAAGNFYFADTGNNRIRRVDSATGIIRTVAGSGAKGYGGDGGSSTSAQLEAPYGLAVDSDGRVYTTAVAAASQPATGPLKTELRQFGRIGEVSFGSQVASTQSVARTVLISNVGNETLNFTHAGFSSGNTADFAMDPNTTSCVFTQPLVYGQSCTVGFIFTPAAAGSRTALMTLADNTVDGTHLIQLTGTGATKVSLTPATIAGGSHTVGTAGAAQTATLKNTGTALLTIADIAIQGTAASSFSKTTTCGPTLAAGASCSISVVFNPVVSGALKASLVVTDDAIDGMQTIALTGTGTAAAKTQVTLSSKINPVSEGQAVLLTSNVAVASKGQPTGRIQLKEGGTILAESTLSNGVATFKLASLTPGMHVLNAVYLGDSQFQSSTSPAIRQVVARVVHLPRSGSL
jgi:hypothetical protein